MDSGTSKEDKVNYPREEILRAYEERSSLGGLTRTFGVSRTSVTAWLRKKETLLQH